MMFCQTDLEVLKNTLLDEIRSVRTELGTENQNIRTELGTVGTELGTVRTELDAVRTGIDHINTQFGNVVFGIRQQPWDVRSALRDAEERYREDPSVANERVRDCFRILCDEMYLTPFHGMESIRSRSREDVIGMLMSILSSSSTSSSTTDPKKDKD